MRTADRKLSAPSADRNRHAALDALRDILPSAGTVLEVASGTGQHAVHFAEHLPGLVWQPSEIDPVFLESIRAWQEDANLPNLLPPLKLDVAAGPWPVGPFAAIYCSNMIHISPWEATEGLMAGAGGCLLPGAPLAFYGAYFMEGRPTAPSNLEFDDFLRAQNPAWGVRHLEAVTAEAQKHGLELERVMEMPGNNFVVVYRKARLLSSGVE